MNISAASTSPFYGAGANYSGLSLARNAENVRFNPASRGLEEDGGTRNDPARAGRTSGEDTASGSSSASSQSTQKTSQTNELSADEKRMVAQLQARDAEVRAHELAHIAAGGQYVHSGAQFSYQRGPDGRYYAIGGEVGVDSSAAPGDPEATIRKMQVVRAAALAPANPSPQDLSVAARAAQIEAQARSQLFQMRIEEAQQAARARAEASEAAAGETETAESATAAGQAEETATPGAPDIPETGNNAPTGAPDISAPPPVTTTGLYSAAASALFTDSGRIVDIVG